MNVGIARRVLSREVAAGILYYIKVGKLPDAAKITAIFIGLFVDWYRILSVRSVAHSLFQSNLKATEETISRVLLFANLFSQCIVLDPKRNNCWTPVQKGILTTSHAIDESVKCLFKKGLNILFQVDLRPMLLNLYSDISGL